MAKKIKIEKGISVPAKAYHSGKWRDLLSHMKVGESFELPEQTAGAANILKTSIRYFLRYYTKHEFIVQKDDKGQYRCWRIK